MKLSGEVTGHPPTECLGGSIVICLEFTQSRIVQLIHSCKYTQNSHNPLYTSHMFDPITQRVSLNLWIPFLDPTRLYL